MHFEIMVSVVVMSNGCCWRGSNIEQRYAQLLYLKLGSDLWNMGLGTRLSGIYQFHKFKGGRRMMIDVFSLVIVSKLHFPTER